MTLEDFFPFVLPHAKGCTEPNAEFAIRNAIIELCTKALVWTEEQQPVLSIAGLVTYDYCMADQQRATKLLSLKLNGYPVDVFDPTNARSNRNRGTSQTFAMGQGMRFTINPAPTDDNMPIVTECAVCPTLDATIVSDDMARFAEQIGHGALSKLLATPKRDYTEPGAAGLNLTMWKDDIAAARAEAYRGFSRSYPRTRASWF